MVIRTTACCCTFALALCATATSAQTQVPLHRAVDAAILSDVARDRQAERDARHQPYASPGYGPIASADAARDACSTKARQQAGAGALLIGRPVASTMSTGWEVEGTVGFKDEGGAIPFVCSVRNGSVSGILLHQ